MEFYIISSPKGLAEWKLNNSNKRSDIMCVRT